MVADSSVISPALGGERSGLPGLSPFWASIIDKIKVLKVMHRLKMIMIFRMSNYNKYALKMLLILSCKRQGGNFFNLYNFKEFNFYNLDWLTNSYNFEYNYEKQ